MTGKKRLLSVLGVIVLLAAVFFVLQPLAGGEDGASLPPPSGQEETLPPEPLLPEPSDPSPEPPVIREDGWYSSPEEVALYLTAYGALPGNFLTKEEARELGWDPGEGNLWEVAEGMSIGGDRFGNREGLLPKKRGRQWYECDVNYEGGFRGTERILFSDDGLIYYTADHYESFTEIG